MRIIGSKKEPISVKDHLYQSILPIFKFDPRPDFIRTSESDLLTESELSKVVDEDHYLLAAMEFERLIGEWSRGRITELPKSVGIEVAYDKLSYWLGFCMPYICKQISGEKTAMKKAEVALSAINEYLNEFAENSKENRDTIIESLGMVFTYRVLGQLPSEELQGKRYYYVRSFGTNLCKGVDKEITDIFKKIKLTYFEPDS